MSFESLSQSVWFTVAAYVSAILPWTVIASTDFISSTWKSVRNTRRAGYRDLVWTFVPMAYVVFYSVVQAKVGEYSEMCASAIAAVLAALLGLRTIWGLWQLYEFRCWAENAIDALDVVGIRYCLHGYTYESISRMSSREISDEILVNDKIADNQIMHGEVHCFLKFGDIELLSSREVDTSLAGPLLVVIRWVAFTAAVLFEYITRIFTKSKRQRVKQVPLKAAEVWVRWAAAFASQGLQKWLCEFEVVEDPRARANGERETAKEAFFEKGRYFGAEVLASAALHLWSEYGEGKGLSPMLWGEWDEQSEMTDGRVVKQELLRDAMESGECLPFGGSQLGSTSEEWNETNGAYYGYDAYNELMGEFISELPVQSSFVKEMRKFNINMLEWLTIMLHIGTMSRKLKYDQMSGDDSRTATVGSSEASDSWSATDVSRSDTDAAHEERAVDRSEEATGILCSQLNLREGGESARSGTTFSQGVPISSIPIVGNVNSVLSTGNRLVPKVGELVDVWVSLVIGDQIKFLVDELNDDWEHICLGGEEDEQSVERGEMGDDERIRKVHKELEKRRLERRAADKNHRYGYLDQFVSFMGYRMESVRSFMGWWVEENALKSVCGDDLFLALNTKMMNGRTVEIALSESLRTALRRRTGAELFRRRAVQSRLI